MITDFIPILDMDLFSPFKFSLPWIIYISDKLIGQASVPMAAPTNISRRKAETYEKDDKKKISK